MISSNEGFRTAMKLAAISGLRAALGPALLATSRGRPERQNLAMAAMGEMVLDKMPLMPSRSAFPLLVPRALAGAWVAKKINEENGQDDPWVPVMGAAVAVGVATFAPIVRNTLRHVLGVPDFMLGMAEDYMALKVGCDAVGMSMDDVKQIAGDSMDEVKERLLPMAQSIGAGSM